MCDRYRRVFDPTEKHSPQSAVMPNLCPSASECRLAGSDGWRDTYEARGGARSLASQRRHRAKHRIWLARGYRLTVAPSVNGLREAASVPLDQDQ